MNHTSTIAALREIADTLCTLDGCTATDEMGISEASQRLRDIAITLERQGGALDQAAMAEQPLAPGLLDVLAR